MTNIKKLSDYTVSDIEKILKENLSDYDMIWRCNSEKTQRNLRENVFKFKDNLVVPYFLM